LTPPRHNTWTAHHMKGARELTACIAWRGPGDFAGMLSGLTLQAEAAATLTTLLYIWRCSSRCRARPYSILRWSTVHPSSLLASSGAASPGSIRPLTPTRGARSQHTLVLTPPKDRRSFRGNRPKLVSPIDRRHRSLRRLPFGTGRRQSLPMGALRVGSDGMLAHNHCTRQSRCGVAVAAITREGWGRGGTA